MFMAMNSVSLKNSVDTGFDGEDSGFSELVTRFCMPLCSRDSQVREIALEAMGKTVEGWLDGYGSPKHHCPPNSQRSSSPPGGVGVATGVPSNGHCANEVDGIVDGGNGGPSNGNGKIVPKEYLDLVMIHLPAVLRLSINCPFADVREKCKEILNLVKERGVPVPQPSVHGPSAYIPADELPPLGTHNEQTHMLFIDAFLQNNRLDHVTQVIGYHPTYLDVFLRTQNFILRGDGPLPYDYRHFIAIMAAGRHQCSYLINLQKQEFLLQGGDPTWLKGLSQIPQKLRDLYEINKILAHRPWLLNKSHIEKLTKGKDSWSLAEVVHAIVLLAHFHSLSSFVFGCGVNEELDRTTLASPTSDDSAATHVGGRISPTSPTANSEHVNSSSSNVRDASSPIPTGSPNSSGRYGPVRSPISHNGAALLVSGNAGSGELEAVGVETLMQRMKSLSERAEEFSAEERNKRFEHVESQSAELLLSPAGMLSSTQVKADIGQFVEDPTFLYQDFARRGEMGDIPTFRVQDYSWDDHGYSLVNRLYNDVGNLLDEKFKTAYNLTYYTMGGMKDVDTSRFRRAIWNYIQCMFGIRHDDYDYGEVNQLLERSLKAFIKSACCFPERVTKKDYDSVLREFKHSEKVHVNLMVLEARMQAELLYALRAVMRYMT